MEVVGRNSGMRKLFEIAVFNKRQGVIDGKSFRYLGSFSQWFLRFSYRWRRRRVCVCACVNLGISEYDEGRRIMELLWHCNGHFLSDNLFSVSLRLRVRWEDQKKKKNVCQIATYPCKRASIRLRSSEHGIDTTIKTFQGLGRRRISSSRKFPIKKWNIALTISSLWK